MLERAFRAGKEKQGFALCEFSVQRDHVHLIVEAESREQLARGMQGLAIRVAKALNRLWARRRGAVFAERYFARALKKPVEVWRALRYVLQNGRKHGVWFSAEQPDPFSSGRWFRGWVERIRRPLRRAPVARPRTFDVWWNCLGPIGVTDLPGPRAWR